LCWLISCAYNRGMAFSNKYAGNCASCNIYLPKHEGIYDYGLLTCTPAITTQITGMEYKELCLPTYNAHFNTAFTTSEEAHTFELTRRAELEAASKEGVRAALVTNGLRELAIEANVRSLQQVINKVTGETIVITDLTWEQATAVAGELHKRIDRKHAKKNLDQHKRDNTCTRCAGAGEADRWKYTGRTCFKCGGTGKFYNW